MCVYVQTIVRSKVLMSRLSKLVVCAFRVAYVCQIFMRSKGKFLRSKTFVRWVRSKFCAFRLSCVQKSSCPDFRAFRVAYVQIFMRSKGKCVHVQTIVRSNDLICRHSCVQMSLCPNFRVQNCSKGKLVRSKTDNLCVYVQTIVRSKDLICRLSCVQNCLCPDFHAFQKVLKFRALQNWYFVRSCPDYRAFEWPYMQTFVRSKLPFKTAYVQTFVRSKGKLVRSKTDNLCVYVQTIVRSKDIICRLSCVQNCLCPDFRAFQRKIRALQNW